MRLGRSEGHPKGAAPGMSESEGERLRAKALDLLRGGAHDRALEILGSLEKGLSEDSRVRESAALGAGRAPLWAMKELVRIGWIRKGSREGQMLARGAAFAGRFEALDWAVGEGLADASEMAEEFLGRGLQTGADAGMHLIREMTRAGAEPSDAALKAMLSKGPLSGGLPRDPGEEHPLEDLLRAHAKRIRGFQQELCDVWAMALQQRDQAFCAMLARLDLAPEGLRAPKGYQMPMPGGGMLKDPTLLEMALCACRDPQERASVERFNPLLAALLESEEMEKDKRAVTGKALSALSPGQLKSAAKLGLNPMGRDADGRTAASHWAERASGYRSPIDEKELAMSARVWPELWLLPEKSGGCALDRLQNRRVREEIEKALALAEGKALKEGLGKGKAPKASARRGI